MKNKSPNMWSGSIMDCFYFPMKLLIVPIFSKKRYGENFKKCTQHLGGKFRKSIFFYQRFAETWILSPTLKAPLPAFEVAVLLHQKHQVIPGNTFFVN